MPAAPSASTCTHSQHTIHNANNNNNNNNNNTALIYNIAQHHIRFYELWDFFTLVFMDIPMPFQLPKEQTAQYCCRLGAVSLFVPHAFAVQQDCRRFKSVECDLCINANGGSLRPCVR